MNFYKRHIGDYLKDTAHLSLIEHGVYARLLDVYYTRESGIPQEQAARLIGARSREELAALRAVLTEFFELVEGIWVQDRCEREISATGAAGESEEGAPAKTGKARRQQEYRDRRSALFEALRERGITMPFKATMNELQDALLSVTKSSRVMPTVTDSVTERVTDTGHNVTATNSQTPDSRLHKPEEAAAYTPEPVDNSAAHAPPLREIESNLNPAERNLVPLVLALREAGITVVVTNPLVAQWSAKGLTVERVASLRQVLDTRGKDRNVHPNYVDTLIDDVLTPPPPKQLKPQRGDAWWVSHKAMEAKAAALGIPASKTGEKEPEFRARIQQAIDAQEAAA